jgi:hypothetical protein
MSLFRCRCSPGFAGHHCQLVVNEKVNDRGLCGQQADTVFLWILFVSITVNEKVNDRGLCGQQADTVFLWILPVSVTVQEKVNDRGLWADSKQISSFFEFCSSQLQLTRKSKIEDSADSRQISSFFEFCSSQLQLTRKSTIEDSADSRQTLSFLEFCSYQLQLQRKFLNNLGLLPCTFLFIYFCNFLSTVSIQYSSVVTGWRACRCAVSGVLNKFGR